MIASLFRFCAAFAVLFGFSMASFAQDDVKKEEPKVEFKAPALKPLTEKLPPAFFKKNPENVEELKSIQDHVASVVEKVMPAVVSVRVGQASGSGVIVSKDGYILTAGHVSGKPDRDVVVFFHNSTKTVKPRLWRHHARQRMIKITSEGVAVRQMGAIRPQSRSRLVHGDSASRRFSRTTLLWCALGRVLKNDENRDADHDAVSSRRFRRAAFDRYGRSYQWRIGNSLASNMRMNRSARLGQCPGRSLGRQARRAVLAAAAFIA